MNTIKRLRELKLGKSYNIHLKGRELTATVTDIRSFGRGYTVFFRYYDPHKPKRQYEDRRALKQFEKMIEAAKMVVKTWPKK